MSDHPPKKAKRTLKKIRICDDGCFDVFRLLPPKKVGLEVAAVSDRFDALVDTQFEHYRKWTLGELEISSEGIVKYFANWPTDETLPFPQIPLPNSVVGFARVNICQFNSDAAIAFLQRIGRLLQSDISLEFNLNEEKNLDDFAKSVLPLLNLSAITKICFGYPSNVHHFRRVSSSPSILCDCANLRIVALYGHSFQFPPDDSDGSTAGQALCQWLHTPRADGRPKVLQNHSMDGIFPLDELKSHFSNATTSVNFIICLRYIPAVSFELVNSLTREQMKCRLIGGNWMIVRGAIGKNEKQWADWEDEAVKDPFENNWKTINIADFLQLFC